MKRFKNYFSSFRRDENGITAVVIAISMVVLLGMTSLVVDVGLTYYQRSRLQTAADSAALAGAAFLPDRVQAEKKAREYLSANGFVSDSEHCKVDFPANNQITVTPSASNKTIFGNIFGIRTQKNICPATAEHADEDSDERRPFVVDFDYVLYSGSKTAKLDLGGQYVIEGGVHGNNSVSVGGSTQILSGTGKRCGVYGNTSACGTVTSTNNQVYGNMVSSADFVPMPDYDDIIMQDCPVWKDFDDSHIMAIKNSNPVPSSTISSSSISSSNPTVVNGPVVIQGNYSKTWGNNIFTDDIYINGNLSLGGVSVFEGDLYVFGDFKISYGSLVVKGNLFVSGNTNLAISANIAGKSGIGASIGGFLYTGGNYTSGSSGLEVGGDWYVKGTFTISTKVNNIGGSIYGEKGILFSGSTALDLGASIYSNGNLTMNSAQRNVPGDIYCNGVAVLYGNMDVWGDIYAAGDLTFTGNFPSVTTHGGYIYSGEDFFSGQGFNTEGVFVAEGNVEVYGRPSTINGTVALYSRNGNIVFSPGTGMVAYGMVYAPKGKITFGSGDMEFHGNVIGDSIACYPGGLTLDANMVDPISGEVHPLPFETNSPLVRVRLIN